MHQSYLNWLVSVAGENTKEIQAWRRTLLAMERWIAAERTAFDPFYRHKVAGTPPATELRELEKIKTKMRTLDRYYGDYAENNYYGADDAAFVAWSRKWLQDEQETHLDPRIDTLSDPPEQAAGEPRQALARHRGARADPGRRRTWQGRHAAGGNSRSCAADTVGA